MKKNWFTISQVKKYWKRYEKNLMSVIQLKTKKDEIECDKIDARG
jgi:hypothetical protein